MLCERHTLIKYPKLLLESDEEQVDQKESKTHKKTNAKASAKGEGGEDGEDDTKEGHAYLELTLCNQRHMRNNYSMILTYRFNAATWPRNKDRRESSWACKTRYSVVFEPWQRWWSLRNFHCFFWLLWDIDNREESPTWHHLRAWTFYHLRRYVQGKSAP